MQCPYCNYKESKVVDSRHTDSNSIRRRRECESCKKRYTTYETIETTPVMVVKKDNTREYFDREKIKNGLIKSCEKRPVSIDQIEGVPSHCCLFPRSCRSCSLCLVGFSAAPQARWRAQGGWRGRSALPTDNPAPASAAPA